MQRFILMILLSHSLFGEISFNRDIRPILSKYCFHCHGPDEESREKKLRLDIAEGELGAYRTRRGKTAIKPGDPMASHVYLRMISDDEDDIMPPPDIKKEMKAEEIALIKQWIEEGAEYEGHWAFDKPKKSELPTVNDKEWSKNEIDHFILAELDKKGLKPSIEANKRTLIRRLYLDLTGASPNPEEVDQFLKDNSPSAYETLVDKILSSPAHAERLAIDWLDTARYADSNGYSIDDHRDMWAWRDWVIKSFMDNMSYDNFLTQQVAGDFLVNKSVMNEPDAFWIWKNNMKPDETINLRKHFQLKTLPKEAFLNATCDDSFELSINNQKVTSSKHWNDAKALDVLKYLKVGKNVIHVKAVNDAGEGGFVSHLKLDNKFIVTDRSWQTQFGKGKWERAKQYKAYGSAPWGKVLKLKPIKQLDDDEAQMILATGFLRNGMNTHEGGTLPQEYITFYHNDKVDTVSTTFMGLTTKCAQCHDHKFDPISQKDFYSMYAFFDSSSESGMGAGRGGNSKPFIQVNSLLTPKDEMIKAYQTRINELNSRKEELKNQKTYLGHQAQKWIGNIDIEIKALNQQMQRGKTSVMIMDWEPKKTHVRIRGQYDQLGEEVEASGLDQIHPYGDKFAKNRLGLAQWMLDKDHPLTARVVVNRYWQLIFGIGIVKTSEDFGSQGEYPSHPKLLDYLAVEFQEQGWNVRELIKKIVMSSTYRQVSTYNDQAAKIDPYNRLHHRAPSFRLQAEFVRDNVMQVSGLLSKKVGGPSVYPSQPGGLWTQISHFGHGSFTKQAYYQDKSLRRSMYTAIKRTAGHPAMAAFDTPSREVCTVRRQQTNTPLQSLVTLNDPQFMRASQALAQKMKSEAKGLQEQLNYGFRIVTGRSAEKREQKVLLENYQEQLSFYSSEKEELEGLAGVKAKAEDGAMIITASMILNLSESMTRN